jgi:hypothetical protein
MTVSLTNKIQTDISDLQTFFNKDKINTTIWRNISMKFKQHAKLKFKKKINKIQQIMSFWQVSCHQNTGWSTGNDIKVKLCYFVPHSLTFLAFSRSVKEIWELNSRYVTAVYDQHRHHHSKSYKMVLMLQQNVKCVIWSVHF